MASHGIPRTAPAAAKSDAGRLKELKSIEEYQQLVKLIESKIREGQYTTESFDLTSRLLKLNPEYYTIWNERRRILLRGFFPPPASPPSEDGISKRQQVIGDLIQSELSFLIPLLRKFPKCYWIWNHRLWLLEQATVQLSTAAARGLWEAELGLVGKMLVLDSRNFHGWGYRRMVVDKLESAPLCPPPQDDSGETEGSTGRSMAEAEFQYTTKMVETNLSNFSAWHYRSKLTPRLLQERQADGEARRAFLAHELETILTALYTDPFDQSVWFYHAWLMSTILPPPASASSSSSSSASSGAKSIVTNLTAHERAALLRTEIQKLTDLLEVADDCKWIYEALIRYSLVVREMETSDRSRAETTQPHDRVAGGEEVPSTGETLLAWLATLRALDPLRRGRWDDLEASIGTTFGF
ncbi:MAG: Rab geranylgeranyltransferase [Thelocarpon superellum]|nr:MAG: Rab geranylgeranyltransferase [Thelocarpon superellum]